MNTNMKYVLILLATVLFSSCSTVKQAQTDFTNFRKTIEWNAGAPAVYKHNYYWLICPLLQPRIKTVMNKQKVLKRIEKLQDKLIKIQLKTNKEIDSLVEQMSDLFLDLRDGEVKE